MATTTAHISTNGARMTGRVRLSGARGRPPGRHRQLPLVVAGVLLVLGGALAFTETALHLQSRENVLVTTAALAAGELLTPDDLRPVAMVPGNGLALVPASGEAGVVGRPLAVPLVAGTPLTSGEVGAPSPVTAGLDTVALLLKPGGYPPDLAAGDTVRVVPVASSSSSGAPLSTTPITATVLAINTASSVANGGTIVTLQVSSADADGVASLAAAGEASLVQQGVGS